MLETLAADAEYGYAKVVLLWAYMPDEGADVARHRALKTEKTLLLPAIRQGELQVCCYLGRGYHLRVVSASSNPPHRPTQRSKA